MFRAWEEQWEKKQFNKKGDSRHAARVSTKNRGLKYYDSDIPDQMGVFPEHDSVILTKCTKATTCTRRIVGKGWIYTIRGVYAGFDSELKLECQVDCMYDKWELNWSFFEMICDYYEKHPDPAKIFMEGECDEEEEDNICGGGGENVDSSNDSSNEEDWGFKL